MSRTQAGSPWRSALAVTLLAIAVGFLYSFVLMPFLHHTGSWRQPPDAWLNLAASHYVPWGGFPLIYGAGVKGGSGLFVAGPVLPILLSPVALVGDLTHAAESYPFPLGRPAIWPLLMTYGLALSVPAFAGMRALAHELGARAGLAGLQLAVLAVAVLPAAIVYGHYEDLLALGLAAFGAREIARDRPLRAGLLFALAVCSKQWAALAIPVAVAFLDGRGRRPFLVAAVGIPAAAFGFFLLADPTNASNALLHPPSFPSTGHAAFWIDPATNVVVGSAGRALSLAGAIALAWWARGRGRGAIAPALGLAFLLRMPFETVVFSYYLGPALALFAVGELLDHGRVTRTLLGGSLMLLWFFVPSGPAWWAGEALLAIPLVVPAVRAVRAPASEAAAVAPAAAPAAA